MSIHFHSHLRDFRRKLQKLEVSAFWFLHTPDIYYLSGFSGEGAWGFVGRREAFMLVPPLARDQAAGLARGFIVQAIPKASEAHATIASMLIKKEWKTIGYDPYRTPEAHIDALRRKTRGKVRWKPFPVPTQSLRIRKEDGEIQALRKAGRLVAEGFAHIRRVARPGLRECDLAAAFESYIRRHGAEKASFDTIVASGRNSAYPHYMTGNRILSKNDIVLCDIGCLVDGYCSDLTRTFFLGRISPLGRRIYETVARAQTLAIQAVRPGVKAAHIDRIARDVIESAGYGRRFIHSTGHGVGVEIHEAPWISPTSIDSLEAGMVLTVEPGIYLQGFGGVRIEDTLRVTQNGSEILTKQGKGTSHA